MNTFTDIVFIFVFVFVILHFGIINLYAENANIVWQKLAMFVAVTIFASLLYVMKAIRRQQIIKPWAAISSGVFIGLLAFIGHTMMFDMLYMPTTQEWIKGFADGKYFTRNVLLAFYICFTILIGKSVGCVFNSDPCIN